MTTFVQTEELFSCIDEKLVDIPLTSFPPNADELLYLFPLNQYVRSQIISENMIIAVGAAVYLVRADSGQKFFVRGTNFLNSDIMYNHMVYRNGDAFRFMTRSELPEYLAYGFIKFFNKKYYLS